MENTELEKRYQDFKWETLGNSVYEDWQGLWEPLWWANNVFSELSHVEREKLAERALRELLAEGLIFFFRRGGKWPHDQAQERLENATAEAAIAGKSWRTNPLGDTSIWFGPTEAGERAARDHWSGTSTT